MYKVSNKTDEQYRNVVLIERAEEGIEKPFFAVQAALKSRRLWRDSGTTNVRFLIDGEVMSIKQMEAWARQEYQSLPKCPWCIKILHGDVFTHSLCGTDIFCSQSCVDKDYQEKCEKVQDEQEIDL